MMSGYEDDIISILKHNLMFHNKAAGWISGSEVLFNRLQLLGFPVTNVERSYRFDYVIFSKTGITAKRLLKALSKLNAGGIIVLQLNADTDKLEPFYRNLNIGLSGTKIRYENRYYLIIHYGDDYGN